jgi:16S rRNA (guanine527-N7)-methyltransferase
MRNNEILLEGLNKWNIHISKHQQAQLETYYDLLIKWNSFMNLTTITEYEEVLVKHFLDSLALFSEKSCLAKQTLMDMGTGAGFPGIPLKIIYPDIKVTLVDSLNKRITFLKEVIQLLELKDIVSIHARAEELAKKAEYREQYDIVVSRALARTASLAEFCIPYVKVGGYFIPYKSGNILEELEEAQHAIKILGGNYEGITNFAVTSSDIQRSLIYIKKIKNTPMLYPRAGGKPLKAPLIKLQ